MNRPPPAAASGRSGCPRLAPLVAAIALLGAGSVGCGEGREDVEPPSSARAPGSHVLLVTIDTLRADRLGCYGRAEAVTPNLDRLAAEGFRFERALCPAPVTLPSHTSLLTGLQPYQHGVRDNGIFRAGDELVTLAEVLADAGYGTAAFVSSRVLAAQYGLAQGFDLYDDDFPSSDGSPGVERAADATVDRFVRWLDDAGSTPWFAWVHLYDPHAPYHPPAAFSPKTRDVSARYDGEIAFVDVQIGRLLDALSARSLAEETLVIVTSDHGESLSEHGEATHGLLVYDAAMRVPLLMRLPAAATGIAARGRVVNGQVSLVDLFPTVLDLLGLLDAHDDGSSAALAGLSLLPVLAPVRAGAGDATSTAGTGLHGREVYMETLLPFHELGWAPLAALSTDEYKFISAPRPELYAWPGDPGELTDMMSRQPEVAARLARRLDALRGGRPTLEAPPPPRG